MEHREHVRSSRRLFVGWQHPESRSIHPVAALVQYHAGSETRYRFAYLQAAKQLDLFEPFASFPELYRVYDSASLFPFFANRVMSPRRSEYRDFMAYLDLSVAAEPFEVLGRSGGYRETDRLEVFPEPELNAETGRGQCTFFVRGLRHVPGAEESVSDLAFGDALRPLLDIQNPKNPGAVLIADERDRLLGYLPDYLVNHLHEVLSACGRKDVRFTVAQVNGPHSPRNLRLMCRVESCWPTGYRPFDGAEFRALVEDAFGVGDLRGWFPPTHLGFEVPGPSW